MTAAPIDQPDFQNPQSGMAVATEIVTAANVPATSIFGPIDVSAYSSVIIWGVGAVGAAVDLVIWDDASGATITEITNPTSGAPAILEPIVVPILGQKVNITNQDSHAFTVNVVSSTRVAPEVRFVNRPAEIEAVDVTQLFAGGTTYGFNNGQGHGRAFSQFRIVGAVLKGTFQCTTLQSSMTVITSSDMVAFPTTGFIGYRDWVSPLADWVWQFTCTTGATDTIRIRTTYER